MGASPVGCPTDRGGGKTHVALPCRRPAARRCVRGRRSSRVRAGAAHDADLSLHGWAHHAVRQLERWWGAERRHAVQVQHQGRHLLRGVDRDLRLEQRPGEGARDDRAPHGLGPGWSRQHVRSLACGGERWTGRGQERQLDGDSARRADRCSQRRLHVPRLQPWQLVGRHGLGGRGFLQGHGQEGRQGDAAAAAAPDVSVHRWTDQDLQQLERLGRAQRGYAAELQHQREDVLCDGPQHLPLEQRPGEDAGDDPGSGCFKA